MLLVQRDRDILTAHGMSINEIEVSEHPDNNNAFSNLITSQCASITVGSFVFKDELEVISEENNSVGDISLITNFINSRRSLQLQKRDMNQEENINQRDISLIKKILDSRRSFQLQKQNINQELEDLAIERYANAFLQNQSENRDHVISRKKILVQQILNDIKMKNRMQNVELPKISLHEIKNGNSKSLINKLFEWVKNICS